MRGGVRSAGRVRCRRRRRNPSRVLAVVSSALTDEARGLVDTDHESAAEFAAETLRIADEHHNILTDLIDYDDVRSVVIVHVT
jgi:hypothetical protein